MSADQTTSSETSPVAEQFSAHPWYKRGRALSVVAALAIAAGGYYWYQARNTGETERPLTATVTYGNIENTVASAGNLQPSNTVPVGAQVSGQLRKLHVNVGDKVVAGQLLGEIDARVQRNKVESSRANIASAEAQIEARRSALELAEANAQRVERLYRERATSQQEYDSTMNTLRSAKASLIQQEQSIVQNRATLATDETQLEYTQVFAPIDGTVVSIAMKEGTTLNATQQSPTVMQIAHLATMTVETQISEADIGKVHVGMDVYFTTLGGGSRRWYSTLRQILPTPVSANNVVTYTGLFDIDNEDGALLSGMTTQVYFVRSAARNVLTVPVGALAYVETPRGEGPAPRMPSGGSEPRAEMGRRADLQTRIEAQPRLAKVRVVGANGSIAEREVTVGVTSRVAAEVLSGLTEGEQVVVGIQEAGQPNGATQNAQRGQQGFPGGGFPGGGFPGGGFPGGGFPGGGNRGR